MELGFKVWIQMGVVSIDASLVCLELVPNFPGKNQTTFRLIFVTVIRQPFASGAS